MTAPLVQIRRRACVLCGRPIAAPKSARPVCGPCFVHSRPECTCGHPHAMHEHLRPGSDCGKCGPVVCPSYRTGVYVTAGRNIIERHGR